jgi:hypothetical protein
MPEYEGRGRVTERSFSLEIFESGAAPSGVPEQG